MVTETNSCLFFFLSTTGLPELIKSIGVIALVWIPAETWWTFPAVSMDNDIDKKSKQSVGISQWLFLKSIDHERDHLCECKAYIICIRMIRECDAYNEGLSLDGAA